MSVDPCPLQRSISHLSVERSIPHARDKGTRGIRYRVSSGSGLQAWANRKAFSFPQTGSSRFRFLGDCGGSTGEEEAVVVAVVADTIAGNG
jgi:hypothetical protein